MPRELFCLWLSLAHIVYSLVLTRTTSPFVGTDRTTIKISGALNRQIFGISSLRAAKDANMTPEERAVALEKATKAMTAFSNKYIQVTGTTYCTDLTVPAVVIKGLAEHKVTLGTPLCPCRYYEDKEKAAKEGFWNCPCVPMRERHECHCMLFLKPENDFAGNETNISYDEVMAKSSGMGT